MNTSHMEKRGKNMVIIIIRICCLEQPQTVMSPEKLRGLSNKSYVPFIKEYLEQGQISNFIYSPGGPPEIDYIRHSTFDINDGRQSFAIQNTFSFIQEGLNGRDRFADNIKHRAESQMRGMRGLLEYTYQQQVKE